MNEYINRDIELLKQSSSILREMSDKLVGIVDDAEYSKHNDDFEDQGVTERNADDIDKACGLIEEAADYLALIINRLEYLNYYYERKN